MVFWVLTPYRMCLFCHIKELAVSICRVTEAVQSELCTSAMEFWFAKIHTTFSYSWHISSFQSLQHTSEPTSVILKLKVTSCFEVLEQTYPIQWKNSKDRPKEHRFVHYWKFFMYVFPLIWIFLGWFVHVILLTILWYVASHCTGHKMITWLFFQYNFFG